MSEAQQDHNDKPERDPKKPGQQERSGSAPRAEEDDLDFVVTEAHAESPELVGGFSNKAAKNNDLGIESTADLMENKARGQNLNPNIDGGPIGESAPPPPPKPEYTKTSRQSEPSPAAGMEESSGIKKLSDDQLEEISRKMRGGQKSSEYLSEEEKFELIRRIDEAAGEAPPSGRTESKKTAAGFDNSPIVPPKKHKKDTPSQPAVHEQDPSVSPKMSRRARGVAFFRKSFIHVTGEQILHEDDELSINGRAYVLRKKRISKKLMWGTLGPLAAILVFVIGAIFSSDANTGTGQIVGLVVDEDSTPILTGVEIRFPDLGERIESNSQGFFKASGLAAGPHKVELIIAGEVFATDFATVAEGEVTTFTLKPEPPEASPPPQAQNLSQAPPPRAESKPTQSKPVASKPAKKSSKPKSKKGSGSKSKYSKLVLAANVENAKLSLDGSVVGAGNLTYSKLKPGKHKYRVAKDGYAVAEGTVELKAGKTKTLKVDLAPATNAEKKKSYLEQDYYFSGVEAAKRGELETAISDLSEAIKLSPSYDEAYLQRAEIYSRTKRKEEASSDYIRAAEILRFDRQYQGAINAYNKAIETDKKAKEAYLGRGAMYLAKSQERAAIADFDMVVRLDKRDIRGYAGLGEARFAQGYFKKAAGHFRDARSIDRKNTEVHLSLMHCYMALGDTKRLKDSYKDFEKHASESDDQKFKKDPKHAGIMRLVKH